MSKNNRKNLHAAAKLQTQQNSDESENENQSGCFGLFRNKGKIVRQTSQRLRNRLFKKRAQPEPEPQPEPEVNQFTLSGVGVLLLAS